MASKCTFSIFVWQMWVIPTCLKSCVLLRQHKRLKMGETGGA